jgi:hypothetical protein
MGVRVPPFAPIIHCGQIPEPSRVPEGSDAFGYAAWAIRSCGMTTELFGRMIGLQCDLTASEEFQ